MEILSISSGDFRKPVTPNHTAVILFVSMGAVVGFIPLALALESSIILVVGGIITLFISTVILRDRKTVATETPGFWEFVLGGLVSLEYSTLVTFGYFLGLILTETFLSLIDTNFRRLLIPTHLFDQERDTFIFWFTVVAMPIWFAVFTPSIVDSVFKKLYQDTAGIKSAFYDLVHIGRRKLLARASIAVLAILVLFLVIIFLFQKDFSLLWFNVIFAVMLYFSTSSLSRYKGKAFDSSDQSAREAVDKLFRASGYNVIGSPRTGRADVDPLLTDLDFFAERPDRAFAVKVFSTGRSELPIDFKRVSGLLPAKWVLEAYLKEDPYEIYRPVDLVLIVIGEPVDSALKKYCDSEHIILINSITQDVLERIKSRTENRFEIAEIADRHLSELKITDVVGKIENSLHDFGEQS